MLSTNLLYNVNFNEVKLTGYTFFDVSYSWSSAQSGTCDVMEKHTPTGGQTESQRGERNYRLTHREGFILIEENLATSCFPILLSRLASTTEIIAALILLSRMCLICSLVVSVEFTMVPIRKGRQQNKRLFSQRNETEDDFMIGENNKKSSNCY